MKKFILLLFLSATFLLSGAQSDLAIPATPEAALGTLRGSGPWTRSDIMLPEVLNVVSTPANLYKIVSFKMVVKTKDGEEKIAYAQGNKITPEMAGNLNLIAEGSTVLFEKIIAKRTDDSDETMLMAPVKYTVTETPQTPIAELEQLTDAEVIFGDLDLKSAYTVDDLKKQRVLNIKSKDGMTYTVESFAVIGAYAISPPTMAILKGNELVGPSVNILTSVQSGDRLLFEQITVTTESNGKIIRKKVAPLIVKVP